MKILKEPKNSILKQYQKLFLLDKVELDFEEKALEAVAQKALERNTGARGLRSIIEETMTDIMFEIPSDDNVEKCIIHENCITDNVPPELVRKIKKAN